MTRIAHSALIKVQKLQSENSPLSNSSSFFDIFERNETINLNETDVDRFLVSNDGSITLLDRFSGYKTNLQEVQYNLGF